MKLLRCSLNDFESRARFVYFAGHEGEAQKNDEQHDKPDAKPDVKPDVNPDAAKMALKRGKSLIAEAAISLRKIPAAQSRSNAQESRNISAQWFDNAVAEEISSKFRAGENVRLIGNKVNMRSQVGGILGKFSRNQEVTVGPKLEPIKVGDLTFVNVINPATGQQVYVAEKFLESTLPATVAHLAAQAEAEPKVKKENFKERSDLKLEIPEGRMVRETVLWRAAQEPKAFPDSNAAWKLFEDNYLSVLKGGSAGDHLAIAYRKVFGPPADIYEDKIKTVWAAVGDTTDVNKVKIMEEVELPAGVDPEPKGTFDERVTAAFEKSLDELRHEVATFYKMQSVPNPTEIATRFHMLNSSNNLGLPPAKDWGVAGSSIKFNYINGNIILHVPAHGEEKILSNSFSLGNKEEKSGSDNKDLIAAREKRTEERIAFSKTVAGTPYTGKGA